LILYIALGRRCIFFLFWDCRYILKHICMKAEVKINHLLIVAWFHVVFILGHSQLGSERNMHFERTQTQEYCEVREKLAKGICRIHISDRKPSWTGNLSSDQGKRKKLIVIFASNMNFKTVYHLRWVLRPILPSVYMEK